MSRHLLILDTQAAKAKARQGIDRAPYGWVLELRAPKRTDEQNAALHGLIGQIMKQRPILNGHKMTMEKYRATFMHALGAEREFLPTLEGDGFFPMGQRTSKLTIAEFGDLLSLILAWTARENITIEHFDEASSTTAAKGNLTASVLAVRGGVGA